MIINYGGMTYNTAKTDELLVLSNRIWDTLIDYRLKNGIAINEEELIEEHSDIMIDIYEDSLGVPDEDEV